jgi:protease-4
MIRNGWAKAAILFALIFIALAFAGRVLAQSLFGGSTGSGDCIALINVEGMITADAGSSGGPLGGTVSAGSLSIVDQLYAARDDDSVKGILLRINSPGGSAAGSDEIFRAIREVRKTKKVVASMGDVAASGGYYIASACDYIYANGATLTGSIGVIFHLVNWGELAAKYGVKEDSLHAGEYKDIGSPWRPMTDSERSQMQVLLAQVHNQFIKAVDEGREPLDEAGVRRLATGMVYTGEQAASNGLVDAVGGMRDAAAKVRELAGVGAGTPVETLGEPSLLQELFGTSVHAPAAVPAALQQLGGIAAGEAADDLVLLARGLYLNTTLRDLHMR